jgi:hypothetical protein
MDLTRKSHKPKRLWVSRRKNLKPSPRALDEEFLWVNKVLFGGIPHCLQFWKTVHNMAISENCRWACVHLHPTEKRDLERQIIMEKKHTSASQCCMCTCKILMKNGIHYGLRYQQIWCYGNRFNIDFCFPSKHCMSFIFMSWWCIWQVTHYYPFELVLGKSLHTRQNCKVFRAWSASLYTPY